LLGVTVSVVAGACGHDATARRGAERAAHVDSAVSRDEELRRFRTGLVEPVALSGGAASRDELVRQYVRALEHADTTALESLAVTRAEFAYLYYPTTPQGRPPYDLSPGLMWFMLQENSRRGLIHAIEERGGHALGYVGYSCDPMPSREGENTVVGPCLIHRRQSDGDVVQERLFGLIVERGQRFKLLSLANKL
jgi:hypothetical protein